MRHPWVNIVLLALLGAQAASGFYGLISGSERQAWALWVHGIGAYAIALLVFWKGQVVLEAWRRRRRPLPARAVFVLLALLLAAVLASGFAWSFAGRRVFYGYSLITIHIVLALVLLVPLAWHVTFMRFVFRSRAAMDRRAVLRLGAALVAGLGAWQIAGRSISALALPGARRRFTGSYETGSMTGEFPTVSWLFDRPGPVDPAHWRLELDGEVERQITLTYEELLAMPHEARAVLLDCTGGWYSTQEWEGVRVDRLMEMAGVKPSAQSVTFEGVSGYSRGFPVEEARNLLLATSVAGRPLNHDHGFPARLVAPDHRGFAWVKWVTRIRANDTSSLLQPPVPLQ